MIHPILTTDVMNPYYFSTETPRVKKTALVK